MQRIASITSSARDGQKSAIKSVARSVQESSLPVMTTTDEVIMTEMQPRAATVQRTCQIFGITRTRLYAELAKGTIVARKAGRRTLVDLDSVQRYFDSLPPATFRSPPKPAAAA